LKSKLGFLRKANFSGLFSNSESRSPHANPYLLLKSAGFGRSRFFTT